MKNYDIRLDEVENFDAIIRNAGKKLETPVEQGTDAESCCVKRRRRGHMEQRGKGRPFLTERQREIEAFDFQRCVLHKGAKSFP